MIGALFSGATDLFNLGVGIKQNKEAQNIDQNTTRPKREVNDATKEAVALSRVRAFNDKLPGQDAIEDKIAGNAANTSRVISNNAQTGSEAIMGHLLNNNNTNDALQGLSVKQAQNKDLGMSQYLSQLANLSLEQNKNFDYNKVDPYNDAMAASAALSGGGMENMGNSLNSLSAMAEVMYGAIAEKKLFNPMNKKPSTWQKKEFASFDELL